MPPASKDPPHSHSEDAVSREDFELLQRFLRVARLLQAQDIPLDPLLERQQALPRGGDRPSHVSRTSPPHPPPENLDQSTMEVSLDAQQDEDDYDEDEYDDEDEDMHFGQTSAGVTDTAMPGSMAAARLPSRNDGRPNNTAQARTRSSSVRQRQETQGHARRESLQQPPQRPHAAVEKRYRSVLNSKIQELSTMIPASNTFSLADEPSGPSLGENANTTDSAKQQTKSVVLDRAIQYIHHLVSTYEQYEAEQNNLRAKLQLWLDDTSLLVDRVDLTQP